MPVTFYGKWSLEVVGNVGEFQQRLRIVGSAASDGVVGGAVGTQVAAIDGASWNVFMERSADGGATWLANLVQGIPTVTPADGLTIMLYGDDSLVPPQLSDVTAKFVYLNPQVNPPSPVQPPLGYTVPPGQFWPAPPKPICPCCRKFPCCCCHKTARRRCC